MEGGYPVEAERIALLYLDCLIECTAERPALPGEFLNRAGISAKAGLSGVHEPAFERSLRSGPRVRMAS
jgi:hypothetical protein